MSSRVQYSKKLADDISALKLKQMLEYRLLQAQMHTMIDDLKPVNLIKGAIKQVANSSSIQHEVVDYVKENSLKFVIKKCAEIKSNNKLVNVASTLLGFGLKRFLETRSEEKD
ncbi:MAG: hypothetical protein IPI46_05860 [Bacteroidetes bacterium]|nr:hypothetical protein [Bacteroidota bacterium]